jgi:hypothetical protein
VNAFSLPINMCFYDLDDDLHVTKIGFIDYIFDHGAEVIFIVDIFLNMRVTYFDSR